MADEVEADIVRRIVEGILQRYRIDADRAAEILRSEIARSKPMRDLLAGDKSSEAISRTSAYKNLETAARKAVYAALRQYRSPVDILSLAGELRNAAPAGRHTLVRRIAEAHVSTRERLDSLAEFHKRIAPHLSGTVLDVGCGVYPMLFAESFPGHSQSYLALDRDAASVEALSVYAEAAAPFLEARRWACSDGWSEVAGRFDVALLLKVVPVIHRQERDSLVVLRDTPAAILVVTGARESMTKKKSIERRERAVLLDFLSGIDGEIVEEFETGDELGVIFRRHGFPR